MFIGVAGPGVMADWDAIQEFALWQLIETLQIGFVSIGNAAYLPTEHMTSIYFERTAKQPKNDNWNYYASQC